MRLYNTKYHHFQYFLHYVDRNEQELSRGKNSSTVDVTTPGPHFDFRNLCFEAIFYWRFFPASYRVPAWTEDLPPFRLHNSLQGIPFTNLCSAPAPSMRVFEARQ